MKLAAIYNVWDGIELLQGSIEQIRPVVDEVILVGQTISNRGEVDSETMPFCYGLQKSGLVDEVIEYTPPRVARSWRDAYEMELAKRTQGMKLAFWRECTHFINMDCDEYYQTADFAREWETVKQSKHINLSRYHHIYAYFKSPGLRFENYDITIVPGITRLGTHTTLGLNQGHWNQLKLAVDPTRQVNAAILEKSPMVMHHFSYIRADIEKKFRNSTAAGNINKPEFLEEYRKAGIESEVSYMPYGRLISVPNQFKINETFA